MQFLILNTEKGYRYNSDICNDIDECEMANTCDKNALCFNTPGSFECKCLYGFSGDGFTCLENDPCLAHTCGFHEECISVTNGDFACICESGFHHSSADHCVDIDECETNSCGEFEQCINTHGSFSCECSNGMYWTKMYF